MLFLLILTTVGHAEDAQRLHELHPCKLPAIYSLRPEQALPAFADWVQGR